VAVQAVVAWKAGEPLAVVHSARQAGDLPVCALEPGGVPAFPAA